MGILMKLLAKKYVAELELKLDKGIN